MAIFLYAGVVMFSYKVLTIMIDVLPSEIEWIESMVLPIMKLSHALAYDKLIRKAEPYIFEALLIELALFLESNHSFYEALFLANVTEVTVYGMLAI